jgi:hypothetical protein
MGRAFSASAMCSGFGAIAAFHSVYYVRPGNAALVIPSNAPLSSQSAMPEVWGAGVHICLPLWHDVVPVDLHQKSNDVQVVVRRSADGSPGCCSVRITYHVDAEMLQKLHTTYGLSAYEHTFLRSSTAVVIQQLSKGKKDAPTSDQIKSLLGERLRTYGVVLDSVDNVRLEWHPLHLS